EACALVERSQRLGGTTVLRPVHGVAVWQPRCDEQIDVARCEPRKNLRVTALRDLDGMAEALEHLGNYAAGDRIEAETDLSETHHSAIRTPESRCSCAPHTMDQPSN